MEEVPKWFRLEEALKDLQASPPFRRLWKIRQLPASYSAFPQANHSRAEHSLGVFDLGWEALRHLGTLGGLQEIKERTVVAMVVGYLLHDIGHLPFSHTLEEGLGIRNHEQVGREVVTDDLRPLLEKIDVDPQLVADLIDTPLKGPEVSGFEVLKELLSGPVGVDRLDYVRRDWVALDSSIPFNSKAVLESYRVHNGHLVVSAGAVEEVGRFLQCRALLYEKIYWSPQVRTWEAVLRRAVEAALVAGVVEERILVKMTDDELLECLKGKQMPGITRALALSGGRYREVVRLGHLRGPGRRGRYGEELVRLGRENRGTEMSSVRRHIEEVLANVLNLQPGQILLDLPPRPLRAEAPGVLLKSGEVVPWEEATSQKLRLPRPPEMRLLIDKKARVKGARQRLERYLRKLL